RVGERWEPLRSSNWVCPAIHLQRTTHLDPGAELTGRILVDAPGDYRARVFIGARTDGTNPSVVTGTFAVR
ncbi:MAG TPA: hypothetical protein VEA99_14310, partial [Gemmatimonadaceae bacterium]|nr:hypothetical protein [Gemmatimonadaceae bacterium]